MQSLEEVQTSLFANGGLTIDYAAGCACLDGEELHLTPYEYKLLCLLAHQCGKGPDPFLHNQGNMGRCLGTGTLPPSASLLASLRKKR